MRRNRPEHSESGKILKVGLGLVGIGMVLLSFVWWPIQAERARVSLSQWELRLSQKKTELNLLQARYASLTSLHVLDQWAGRHGPWRAPASNDIVIVSN